MPKEIPEETRVKRLNERKGRIKRQRERIKYLKVKERSGGQQHVEKDAAYAKAFSESVEETSPIHVPDMLQQENGILKEVEERPIVKDFDRTITLTAETEGVREETVDYTKKIQRETEQGRYLYCVIASNGERTFGDIDLNQRGVYAIPFRDVSAVVSPSPMKDYELTEENAMNHQEVIQHIMNEYTLIPAEFGAIIKNEMILKNLMTKSYNAIRRCIKIVDGKVELGVKAVLERSHSLTLVGKNEIAKDITYSLKKKAEQMKNGDLFSDRLILNSSFLVEKKLIDEFSTEIERLQEKYVDKLNLLYSGPWAPYSFVYIKIGEEDMSLRRK